MYFMKYIKMLIFYATLASIISSLGFFMDNDSMVLGSMLISPMIEPIYTLASSTFSIGIIYSSVFSIIILSIIAYCIGISASILNHYINYFKVPTEQMAGYTTMPKYVGNVIVPFLAGIVIAVSKPSNNILAITGVGLIIAVLPPIVNGGLYHGNYIWNKTTSHSTTLATEDREIMDTSKKMVNDIYKGKVSILLSLTNMISILVGCVLTNLIIKYLM